MVTVNENIINRSSDSDFSSAWRSDDRSLTGTTTKNETKPSPFKFADWYVHTYLYTYISLSTSVSLVNGNNRSWLIIYESPARRRRRRRKQKCQWQSFPSIIVLIHTHTFYPRSPFKLSLNIQLSLVHSLLGNTSLLHHHQMNIKICFLVSAGVTICRHGQIARIHKQGHLTG